MVQATILRIVVVVIPQNNNVVLNLASPENARFVSEFLSARSAGLLMDWDLEQYVATRIRDVNLIRDACFRESARFDQRGGIM